MTNEEKPKGKAIEVEADEKPPTRKEVSEMQELARNVSPLLLGLLEAEDVKDEEKNN